MKSDEIIEFVKDSVECEFNCNNDLEILIVGSLAIKIKLNSSLESYFNGESDIDCLVLFSDDKEFEKAVLINDTLMKKQFLDGTIDILNYSIAYGERRNKINIKFIKRKNLYKFTNINEINFRSIRQFPLTINKDITTFYGEKEQIEFTYRERSMGTYYLIEYRFSSIVDDVYYLCDIHSMLLFSINISNRINRDLPELLIFKEKILSRIVKDNNYFYYTLFKNFHKLIDSPKQLKKILCQNEIFFLHENELNNFDTFCKLRQVTKIPNKRPVIFLIDKFDSSLIDFDFNDISVYSGFEFMSELDWLNNFQESTFSINSDLNEDFFTIIVIYNLITNLKCIFNKIYISVNVLDERAIKKFDLYFGTIDISSLAIEMNTNNICDPKIDKYFYYLMKLEDNRIAYLTQKYLSVHIEKVTNIEGKYSLAKLILQFLFKHNIEYIELKVEPLFKELTDQSTRILNNIKIIEIPSEIENLYLALYLTGDFSSKNELRRLFCQSSIRKASGEILKIECNSFKGEVIKVGKRKWYQFK